MRDNYDLPDGRRILIATDRISAFDRILAAIPLKGQVLTQMARFWFEATGDICPQPRHRLSRPQRRGGAQLDILPVEIVVRGYLAGTTSTSILTMYKAGQRDDVRHAACPTACATTSRSTTPIITPTSKAFDGGHDEPLTAEAVLARGLASAAQWRILCDTALALFARGTQLARRRGLILADTKYEFGTDPDGRIVLADEIHTPDSSRYWLQASYATRFAAANGRRASTRIWSGAGWRRAATRTRIRFRQFPRTVILATAGGLYSRFRNDHRPQLPSARPSEPPLERIRRNLAAYLEIP